MVHFFWLLSLSQFQPLHLMQHQTILGCPLKITWPLTGCNIIMSSYSLLKVKLLKVWTSGLPLWSRTRLMATYLGIQLKIYIKPLTLYKLETYLGRHTSFDMQDWNPLVLFLNGWSKSMSWMPGTPWCQLNTNMQHQHLMETLIMLHIKNLGLMVSMYGQILCLVIGHGSKVYIFLLHTMWILSLMA